MMRHGAPLPSRRIVRLFSNKPREEPVSNF
jgi:hypothetical protein